MSYPGFELYGKFEPRRRGKNMKEGKNMNEGKGDNVEKKKPNFDFWSLFDKKTVCVELTDGQRFRGTLRAKTTQRYDILIHMKNNDKISTVLVRKDVIRLMQADEVIFPVLPEKEVKTEKK